jgi:TM2 domain-containing membrane protein YozV
MPPPYGQGPYGQDPGAPQDPYGSPPGQGSYGLPAGQDPYGPPPGQDPYGSPPGQDPYGSPPGQGQYGLPPGQPPPQPPQWAYPASGPPVSGMPVPGSPLPVPYTAYLPYAPTSPYGPGVGAGYGFDPLTGEPLSPKSKIVAGLLQLLLGALVCVGGVGRLYAGNVGLGVAQIVCSVVAYTAACCGVFLFFVPWFFTFGIWVWFVVDGIIMLAGRPRDGQGRLLRS